MDVQYYCFYRFRIMSEKSPVSGLFTEKETDSPACDAMPKVKRQVRRVWAIIKEVMYRIHWFCSVAVRMYVFGFAGNAIM